jgi:hypothetical protein
VQKPINNHPPNSVDVLLRKQKVFKSGADLYQVNKQPEFVTGGNLPLHSDLPFGINQKVRELKEIT